MSHIVSIDTQVRDPLALAAACRRLGVPEPVAGTARLFEGTATGLIVHLPGWRYPAVVDPASGTVRHDTYNGRWGSGRELERLLQAYAVEKAKLEARRAGHSVSEVPLADGSIKLLIQVGTTPAAAAAAAGGAR